MNKYVASSYSSLKVVSFQYWFLFSSTQTGKQNKNNKNLFQFPEETEKKKSILLTLGPFFMLSQGLVSIHQFKKMATQETEKKEKVKFFY